MTAGEDDRIEFRLAVFAVVGVDVPECGLPRSNVEAER